MTLAAAIQDSKVLFSCSESDMMAGMEWYDTPLPPSIATSPVRSPGIQLSDIQSSVTYNTHNYYWSSDSYLHEHKRVVKQEDLLVFDLLGSIRALDFDVFHKSGKCKASGVEFIYPKEVLDLISTHQDNKTIPPTFCIKVSFESALPSKGLVFPMFRHDPQEMLQDVPDERIPRTSGHLIHLDYIKENVSLFESEVFYRDFEQKLAPNLTVKLGDKEHRLYPLPVHSHLMALASNSNQILIGGTTGTFNTSYTANYLDMGTITSSTGYAFDGYLDQSYTANAITTTYSNAITINDTIVYDSITIAPSFKEFYLSPDPNWLFDGINWIRTSKPLLSLVKKNLAYISPKKNHNRSPLSILPLETDAKIAKGSLAELKARETLREYLSESEYRRYITNGFVMVKGSSGKFYQVFGDKRVQVYLKNKVVETICIHSSDCPPSDHVLNMKILIESNEQEFRKLGNISAYWAEPRIALA